MSLVLIAAWCSGKKAAAQSAHLRSKCTELVFTDALQQTKELMTAFPDVRFKRTSVISTIRLSGESVPMMFKGTLDGDLFIGYIDNFLAPTLKESDILVIGNLSAHKKYELDSVYEQGAEVWFVPRYSPDLNPCENAWSKTKSTLRREKARNEQDLEKAMGIALEFTPDDLIGWFKHCGVNVNI